MDKKNYEKIRILNSEENNLIYDKDKNNNINNNINIRFDILDNFKAILIFLVVFTHFLFNYSKNNQNSLSNYIVNYIYSFHMPSFIFVSGFLSKSENSRSFKNLTKLLLIYLIFNFSHGLILYKYKSWKIDFYNPYNSYWYILCLIYWRISINYFAFQYFSITISIIISILIGFWKEINSTFSLRRTFTFFPYFIVGFKISKDNFKKILYFRKRYFFIVSCLFLIFIYLSFSYFPYINVIHSMMDNSYNDYKNDIKIRLVLIIFSFLIIVFSILLIPNKQIPILTKIGKNSLYVYLFHRIFTLIIDFELFSKYKYNCNIIGYSLFFSSIICLFFGNDYFSKIINNFIIFIYYNLFFKNTKGKIIGFIFSLLFIRILLIKPLNIINKENLIEEEKIKNSNLSSKIINYFDFNDIVRISYIGDLILLKDQVIAAKNKNNEKYNFDDIFEYTSEHFKKSHLTIGVYEGPSAGNSTSYSTSNYGDGIPLYLNYPDEFAESVKKAGINLVTTSNNHLLDKNIDGALRTLDILNKYNITHTGSYKNQEEKNKLLTINLNGIKFVILSYTSEICKWNLEKIYDKYPYLTGIIPNLNNKFYKNIYKDIENDFTKAKNSGADYIIVLPHMGTQFNLGIDNFQKRWNKIFSDLGADIILGSHAHAVEPLEILGKTFIVNCPGNFVNSYYKYNGDAASIVDLYFNKINKKFIGSSIVPMYIQQYRPKYFRTLPIFKIINEHILISKKEMKRVEEIQKLITKIMIKKEIPIKNVKKNYFFINGSFVDISNIESKLKNIISEKYTNKKLYKLIDNSYSITFIGDSITEGTKNNYHPWYEPLIYYFRNKKIINISKGSYTTLLIINNYKYHIKKTKSDLYIIALGTNDVRYRDPKRCAMTKEDYINNINTIVQLAKTHNTNAKFVFISPWMSMPDDNISKLKEKDKNYLLNEFSNELNKYCNQKDYLYINPNQYINETIRNNRKEYILDHIHPNKNKGINLYSEAVLYCSK